jgi:hypothetical protein
VSVLGTIGVAGGVLPLVALALAAYSTVSLNVRASREDVVVSMRCVGDVSTIAMGAWCRVWRSMRDWTFQPHQRWMLRQPSDGVLRERQFAGLISAIVGDLESPARPRYALSEISTTVPCFFTLRLTPDVSIRPDQE